MRNSTIIAVFAMLALVNLGFAANSTSNTSQAVYAPPNVTTFHTFLNLYIPARTAANSIFINESVGADTYIIMEINSSPLNFAVINTTGSRFSFVLNQAGTSAVLGPYLVSKYQPSISAIDNITNTVKTYKGQSYGPINDCLIETGIDNYLCTPSTNYNICIQSSCSHVPVCSRVLHALGSPSPFSDGIYNFSIDYAALNTSYSQFFNYAGAVNQSNMASNLRQMSNILSQIYAQSQGINQNPIFPFPTNLSISQIDTTCASAVGFTGPWYCYSIGFCKTPDSNFTPLNLAQAQINNILALPFTNSNVQNSSIQAVTNAQAFYEPIAITGETARFDSFINSTEPGYSSIEANLSFVASKFKNASLDAALSRLVGVYSGIKSAGIGQNLTAANASLKMAEANAIRAYAGPAAQYLAVYNLALNNTASILLTELNYQTPPPYVSALATEQIGINQKLNGQVNISELSSINTQAASVSSQTGGGSSPLSLGAAVKTVEGGAVAAMLMSPSIPLATKMSLSPLYAAMLALLIDILIIIVIYLLTYNRLRSKRKLNLTQKVQKAWAVLFAILFVLALIDTFAIYVYASGANSFLPASGFTSSVASSNTVYVLTNSSMASNQSVQQCITAVKAALSATAKNPRVYSTSFNSNGCTDPANQSVSGASCTDTIISTGSPVIMIDPGNSSIIYRGLYGDVLYVNGASAEGLSCPLGQLIRAG
jgi:hypothetical protein